MRTNVIFNRGKAPLVLGCLVLGGSAVLFLDVALTYWIGTYNSLVAKDEGVSAAWAEVQNHYQRRADLIPNYVEVVKGYMKHERETLEAVVQARASATQVKIDAGKLLSDPAAFKQFQAAQNQLSGALSRLLVTVEKYPDLKANENFMKLQDELAGTENRLAVARTRYNEAARGYNTQRRGFFATFVANVGGFTAKPYFEAEKGTEKAPAINFGGQAPAPRPAEAGN